MLVDRDKAIEACAKALEDFWGNGSTYEHCAAAIRQLTLEDCAPITPTENVVVLQLRTSADGMAFESYGRWSSVCRDAANLIESLSAQVAELSGKLEATHLIVVAAKQAHANAQFLQHDYNSALHDIGAYRLALGFAISTDHNGKLSTGLVPVCGLCEGKKRVIESFLASVPEGYYDHEQLTKLSNLI